MSDNELIAEFMGVKIGVDMYSWRPGVSNPIRVEDLAYDKQWGWLMPVWYKFRDLKFHEFAQPSFNNYCARIAHALAYEDIQNVYYKLTLGIKWYQEYTSNQPQKAS